MENITPIEELPKTLTGAKKISVSVPEVIAPENDLGGIQSIVPNFIPAASQLQKQGIFGVVSVGQSPNVFSVGPGGTWETQESLAAKGLTNQVVNITPEQATKLGINLASVSASPETNPNLAITTDDLTPTQEIKIPGTKPKINEADLFVSEGEQFIKNYQELLKGEEKTAEQTKYEDLLKRFETTMGEGEGRGAAQLVAEETAGVPAKTQALQTANAAIQTKTAEYNALKAQEEQMKQSREGIPGFTLSEVAGQKALIERQFLARKNSLAADIGIEQAKALALQGDLMLAQAKADRAVTLKYDDLTTRLENQKTLLNLLEGQLSKEESVRVDAIKLYISQQQNTLEDQKETEKANYTTLLSQMNQYPDAGIVLTDTLEQANTKITTNSKIYAEQVRPPQYASGGGGGGETPIPTIPPKDIPSVLYSVGIPQTAVSTKGKLTDSQLTNLGKKGIPPTDAQEIMNEILSGKTLEEIRQWMRDNGVDPKVLDDFMTTIQGVKEEEIINPFK